MGYELREDLKPVFTHHVKNSIDTFLYNKKEERIEILGNTLSQTDDFIRGKNSRNEAVCMRKDHVDDIEEIIK